MGQERDPLALPEWHALHREASLIRQLAGSGVTSLGRANYADRTGEYYTAFFALSVSVERLAKLILVIDFSLNNEGRLPAQSIVRGYGHKLAVLVCRVDEISRAHGIPIQYPRPSENVTAAMIECLDSFADASRGRYANFQALGDPSFAGATEPISQWWTRVAEAILAKHFRGKRLEARVNVKADVIGAVLGDFAEVLHFSETGDLIDDPRKASNRTGETQVVQRYSRYYALSFLRWMMGVFSELARHATYARDMDQFFGHWEFFSSFCVDDHFLKTRKVWPLV